MALALAEAGPEVLLLEGKPLSDVSEVESDSPEEGIDILPGPTRADRGERGGRAGGIITPPVVKPGLGLFGAANVSDALLIALGASDIALAAFSPCLISGLGVGVLSSSDSPLPLSAVMDKALGTKCEPSPDVEGVIGDERAALRGGLEGRGGAEAEEAPSVLFSASVDLCSPCCSADGRLSLLVAAVDGGLFLLLFSSSPAVELADEAPISLGS